MNPGQQNGEETKIPLIRRLGLYVLFFLIAFGLGYPILSRYDPRQTPGLTDVQSYAALVTGAPLPGPDHLRFRVLVPWIAKPFYVLARGRLGSWDPVMFGLLLTDSLFVAATTLLIAILGTRTLRNYSIALVASLLYLVNFVMPNLRLAGLVDAGEGFFLLALLYCLSEDAFWCLPPIEILGTLTKESFLPFAVAFSLAWWVIARKQFNTIAPIIWITVSWLAGFAALGFLQLSITGSWISPIKFAMSLQGNHNYLHHFVYSFWDRNLLYIYIWLLPISVPHLRRLPKVWLIPTAAAAATACVLNTYYGGAPGTIGRALFSIAGPILALSSASFLCRASGRHDVGVLFS